MSETKIEWTDLTWNPTTGCSKVSEGCKNCYAERMAKRLYAMGNPRYTNGFEPTEHLEALALPFTWKKPKKVFVNSMSDLFHESISEEFICKVFEVMNNTPMHTYQILTKRPERALHLADKITWTDNIWQGTSVFFASENSSLLQNIFPHPRWGIFISAITGNFTIYPRFPLKHNEATFQSAQIP